MHCDQEQYSDVVEPLARHFCIAGYDDMVDRRIEHVYQRKKVTSPPVEGVA